MYGKPSDHQVVVVGVTDNTYRAYAERGELVTRDGRRSRDARTRRANRLRQDDAVGPAARYCVTHGRVKRSNLFSVGWGAPDRDRTDAARGADPKAASLSEHVRCNVELDTATGYSALPRPRSAGTRTSMPAVREGGTYQVSTAWRSSHPRHRTYDRHPSLGRAIRKAPNKKVGNHHLPVFLPTGCIRRSPDDSSFRHLGRLSAAQLTIRWARNDDNGGVCYSTRATHAQQSIHLTYPPL